MARTRRITLLPPLKGESHSVAFQSQPPYTTPAALNVRPIDVLEERARLGRRPGYSRCGMSRLTGSRTPVRMLANVRYLASGDRAFELWQEDFDGDSLGDVWQAESWIAGGLPTGVADGKVSVAYPSQMGGTIRPADELQIHPYTKDGITSGITSVYSLRILPHEGAYTSNSYEI